MKTASQQSTDESSSSGTVIIYQSNTPAMIIEVKTVVSIESEIVKSQDCIEMLIYCLYITRLFNIDGVLGCVTNGKAWHVL